jgi:Fur family peroxide stress response transcriptional regulator
MEKFRDKGIKLTPQRVAILDYLEGNNNHPSAEEIYAAIKENFPTMSFSTVYSTLETLRKRGELLELTIDPERRRYDPDTGNHHHLICLHCRKIVDVHMDFPISVPDEQVKAFEVTGNHVEFYGICPECKSS